MAIRPSNSASRPGFPVHRNPHAPRPAGRPGSQPTLRLVASRPDYPAFRAGWRSLRNADEFEALCQRHWLEPLQALRHGPVGFTAQLPGGIGDPLMRLVAQCLPMRFDIGRRSGAPAWHGIVESLSGDDDSLLVQARGFSLRLAASRIGSAWRVAIPDTEGLRESMEIFDLRGAPLVSIGPAPGCRPDERWTFGRLLRHALAGSPE
jgi:putative heme degradation protein